MLQSKIEKVPRGIRGEESSKDMASSRNLVSIIKSSFEWGIKTILKKKPGPFLCELYRHCVGFHPFLHATKNNEYIP